MGVGTGSRTLFETGQGVRWRGRRWRVIGEEEGGFIRLVGVDRANRDWEVTPHLALEADEIEPDTLPIPALDFTASDRARWRALHQAFLTTMAGGREQLVGIDWGAVSLEPYQLVPLLRIARAVRPRLLIADDTGLGKTAEAGLILRWLAQRHQAGRVLVVTRAAPEPERWHGELRTKFGFQFDILRSGSDFADRRRRSPTVNVFAQASHLIVSMTLAARQVLLDELRQCPIPFDVVIVDEAHHLAERGSGTKRLVLLARALRGLCANGTLLLLTATPHDGKSESFLSLLRLLDPLIETGPGQVPIDLATRLVVRRLKSEVTLVGGRRFLPPAITVLSTLKYAAKHERSLDAPLDAYLDWLAHEEARYQGEGARQKATGCQFLAGLYRKRFGSSVAALRATLRRRLQLAADAEDHDEVVPYADNDASDPEDDIIDPGASADAPPPPLSARERELAGALLDAARAVPPGRDSKLEAMVRLLQQELSGEKVVIFTEYRDTLRAAARRLDGQGISYVTFHGETPEAARERAIADFIHDPDVQVFLATDAASEGKNLQRGAHHLIHLDVPWNPNRYAQRNGRIDRYGQLEEPHIWVLVAADRRKGQGRPESRAMELVVEKLGRIERELGSVSPVLPVLGGGTVQDLLARAGKDAEEELDRLIDAEGAKVDAETISRLTVHNQREIRDAEREVAGLRTIDDFEPHVGGLLDVAFRAWNDGGAIAKTEPGYVSVVVPRCLQPVLGRLAIERATFRRDVAVASQDDEEDAGAEFLSPGHPLVETTLRRLRDEAADPACRHRFDIGTGSREGLVLSFVARFVDGDGRTIEERLLAVEVAEDGAVPGSPEHDLERLGVLAAPRAEAPPDARAVARWTAAYPTLIAPARAEAERRAEARRAALVETAQRLREEELEVLARWRGEEEVRVEWITLGADVRLTLEGAQEYERATAQLEAEYAARRDAVRDRSQVRLASLDLIGGRLIVGPAP